MIELIFVATALAICLPLLYFLFPKHKWLPNIPIKSDHWLVGLKGFDNGNVIHELVQKYGPLIQFSLYFHKILVIADKNLAKVALKEINGKGFFHNPTPDWVADSIFSFDTGPEWQKRRGMFRKAFSTSSLRYHTKSVVKLNEKLSQVLEKAAEKNEVVRIDDLFVQLTVGVICELAFELDVKVFDSSTNTLRVAEAIQELFKVSSFLSLAPPLLFPDSPLLLLL
jgi:cytochrome P450